MREPLWYKDAVIYQLHLKAFADGDADGTGDFGGLTEKLDYLASLGVNTLWVLPFYPSPLRDDGYDIADYNDVNPLYGDLKAFRRFLKAAHDRGLKVVTELVINHTSDRHEWFQRARRAKPGTQARNFYVWSDTPEKYRDARIIFKDFESSNWSWDPVAQAYYWHRFYHHQPDLNFEEPAVHKALLKAMDFWFRMGVDGMRLDAIPYLYEEEGTNCENLPGTHRFLKKLRAHVDAKWENRMLLAEANQWPEDAVAYFGDGDECHMAFHFPVMPRLYMSLRMEDRFPIIDILEQTPEIPENCQWATFLRNHDELTLEMVTDEDRDYMYRSYAADRRARINLGIRRRLAPLLGNDRRRIELMNSLLFSLPGTPVLYYGDEIGMGDNIYLGDRDGVRTPMQWSSDRNAGFSRANPQRLYLPVIVDPEYHYEAVNVEAQEGNAHSLLWWTRRLIALRKRYRAFSRGDIEFLLPGNHKVLAFLRRRGDERILVVANLSRFVQHVELDMKGQAPDLVGTTPVELFGRTPFPRIGDLPYLLTLGPHGFYWFSIETERVEITERPEPTQAPAEVTEAPILAHPGDWKELLAGDARGALEEALEPILHARRWFGGKARTIREARLGETIPLVDEKRGVDALFAFAHLEYVEGEAESYVLVVSYAEGEAAGRLMRDHPWAVYARLEKDLPRRKDARGEDTRGLLYDALVDPATAEALLHAIGRKRTLKNNSGEAVGSTTSAFKEAGGLSGELPPRVLQGEQSNTSVTFGDRFILKLFRKLEPGLNPDLEIGRFLTETVRFPHTPAVAGSLELRRAGRGRPGDEPLTLGILQRFGANEGDAWRYSLDALGRFYERVLARREESAVPAAPVPMGSPVEMADAWGELRSLLEAADEEGPGAGRPPAPRPESDSRRLPDLPLLGTYVESAELLGRRTAEMHRALAAGESPDFAPEAFSTLGQRSVYQSMRALTGKNLRLLADKQPDLEGEAAQAAEQVLERREELLDRFGALLDHKLAAQRTRTHGDYHLGQVLWTGRDFLIIDFEGEPARPLTERRIKRSPLRDVAGMLRSFDYAAHSELGRQLEGGLVSAEDAAVLTGWARYWQRWISAAYLSAYLEHLGAAGGPDLDPPLVPPERHDLAVLLDVYLLEKALYEMRYELNNRPGWVGIPLAGILQLLENPR